MHESRPSTFKRWHFIFLGVFIVAFFAVRLWQDRMPVVTIVLSEAELQVEVPRTRAQLIRGLGQRSELGEYDGMLFVFDYPGKHTMVMRDMQFPIDIIWFHEGKVVDIAPSVHPETAPEAQLTPYKPRTDATVVLEVPAGWAEEQGLKIGDRLKVQD